MRKSLRTLVVLADCVYRPSQVSEGISDCSHYFTAQFNSDPYEDTC